MGVVLDDEQGYYLMGLETADCQTFILSVSINGIKDLVHVCITSPELGGWM